LVGVVADKIEDGAHNKLGAATAADGSPLTDPAGTPVAALVAFVTAPVLSNDAAIPDFTLPDDPLTTDVDESRPPIVLSFNTPVDAASAAGLLTLTDVTNGGYRRHNCRAARRRHRRRRHRRSHSRRGARLRHRLRAAPRSGRAGQLRRRLG